MADEVFFIPAKCPPHKQEDLLAPGEHRLKMLEIATDTYSNLGVSDIELQREGGSPSYTFDTLETLKRVFSEHRLVFVMGMDSLQDLSAWHRAGELVNRFDFFIYPRPGSHCPASVDLYPHFGPRNTKKLLDSIIDIPELPISSTYIRKTIQDKGSLAGLIPHGATEYIRKHNLYQITT